MTPAELIALRARIDRGVALLEIEGAHLEIKYCRLSPEKVRGLSDIPVSIRSGFNAGERLIDGAMKTSTGVEVTVISSHWREMTNPQAIAEARLRWGHSGWAKMDTTAMGEVLYLVGRGGVAHGSGSSWEAAFAMADVRPVSPEASAAL